MNNVTLAGNAITLSLGFPQLGSKLTDSLLVKRDLSEIKLSDYQNQRLILNIFPSIDTGICASSARTFNKQAALLVNTKVLCISNDLPFALDRFCAAEGIENVETLSAFRSDFGKDNGLLIESSPLKGLLTRAIIVLDEKQEVIYTQLVPEIKTEPNYDEVLGILK